MISRFHLLFMLFAVGVFPVSAQDNAATDSYFRTVGTGVTTNDLYFSANDKDKNINVSDGFRSIIYKGTGAGLLTFYTISKGPDGKQVDTTVAQADVSRAGTLALLTFSPDPATPGHYIVEVLPDDLITFPLGSYRIVNRTPQMVKVTLGPKSVNVAPHATQLVVYPLPTGTPTLVAKVYTASSDNILKPIYADTWGYNGQFRTDILISQREGPDHFLAVARLLDNPTVLLSKPYLPKD